jgi:hypothetical protein
VRAEHLNGLWDAGVALGRIDGHQRARLNRTCVRILTPETRSDMPGSTVIGTMVERAAALEAARAPVDLAELRERWTRITAEPGYLDEAGAPREPFARRILRRAEVTAPRLVGYAKGAARRVLGRTPH